MNDLLCGLTVARFDFSLGDPKYHQETLENLKAAVKSTKKLCAVCISTILMSTLLTTKVNTIFCSTMRLR